MVKSQAENVPGYRGLVISEMLFGERLPGEHHPSRRTDLGTRPLPHRFPTVIHSKREHAIRFLKYWSTKVRNVGGATFCSCVVVHRH